MRFGPLPDEPEGRKYEQSEPVEVHPGIVKPINLRPDRQWQVTWDETDFGDPVTRIG